MTTILSPSIPYIITPPKWRTLDELVSMFTQGKRNRDSAGKRVRRSDGKINTNSATNNQCGCDCGATCTDCTSIVSATVTFSGLVDCGCIGAGTAVAANSSKLLLDPNGTYVISPLTCSGGSVVSPSFVTVAGLTSDYTGFSCDTGPTTVDGRITISYSGGWTLTYFPRAGGRSGGGIFSQSNALSICPSGGTFTLNNNFTTCTGANLARSGTATVVFTYA